MAQAVQARIRFVDLRRQIRDLGSDLSDVLSTVVERADFILGEDVRLLEQEFAAYCEVDHAIGVDSGYSALELSLRAAGVGLGDEVITQANTFIATVGAILAVGATPVLVDCDLHGSVDFERTAKAVTPRTKAVIPVHLFGRVADLSKLSAWAAARGILVLEDACQAHGARVHGRRAGARGDIAAFSFYPGKNLGAFGDGGMVVTSSAGLAENTRLLRNYGQQRKYEHLVGPPLGRRLDTLQAAVLRLKLRRLDAWNEARRRHAATYRHLLRAAPIKLPEPTEPEQHVYHLFVVETEERDELRAWLGECGIETGIHYPIPLHHQPALAALGYAPDAFANTERLAATSLSLPMYPELLDSEVEMVSEAINRYFVGRHPMDL